MVSAQRRFGVDLARTLAIVLVVLTHSLDLSVGRWGVQLFFLVSGYLLAEFSLSPREFLVRRALRLFPLSILVICFFYLPSIGSTLSLTLNLMLLQNGTWFVAEVPGLWSISNEWIFSIAIALMVNMQRRTFAILFAIIYLQIIVGQIYVLSIDINKFTGDPQMYALLSWINTKNPISNFLFFLTGLAIRKGFIVLSKNWKFALALISFSILVHYYVGHVMPLWVVTLPYLFNVLLHLETKNVFFHNLISNIGQTTYGVYFFHFLVLRFLSDAAGIDLPSNILMQFPYFLLVWCLSWLAGNISWKYFERPILKLHQERKRQ